MKIKNKMNMGEQKLKLSFFDKDKFSLLILFLFLTISISSFDILAADTGSFGGGIPTSFSGSNYRVYGASVNPQFTQPSFYGGYDLDVKGYWGNFNREDCKERQDVILMIPPGGCNPAVVRSDLLEEQDVPVFCKVSSIQVNPLIDITKIRSIHFKGDYPPGVAGMSYFPARIAVRSDSKLIGSPIVDNVGYLVIKLKRTANEKDMLDWVGGNVTAVIDYDSEGVFGVGQHDFYLTETNDDEWQRVYESYGFWKGKGFIRLESVDEDSARVSIYKDVAKREASVELKEGETSRDIYLGGYYCAAGMNIKLEDIGYPVDTALIRVDDEDLWLGKGSKFLDGKCSISNLEVYDVGGGKVSLSCTGAGRFDLILKSAEVNLNLDGEFKAVKSGDFVQKSKEEPTRNIYVGYVGKDPGENSNFVVLIKTGDDEISFQNRRVGVLIQTIVDRYSGSSNFLKFIKAGPFGNIYSYIKDEVKKKGIPEGDITMLKKDTLEWEKEKIKLGDILVEGEALENELLKENYDNAVNNYNDVFGLYPSEKERTDDNNLDPYAVTALYNAASLSELLVLQTKQIEYLEKLIENYPNSKLAENAKTELGKIYKNKFSIDSQEIVYINNEPHFISLIDLKKPSYDELGAELLIIDDGVTYSSIETKKDVLEISPGKSNLAFKVKEIKEDYIEIGYSEDLSWVSKGINAIRPETIDKTKKIEIGKTEQIVSGVSIRLVKTNLEKTAKVKIIPKEFGMRTESDFSFKIGIEKRGIKLSPEKTQEMIDNLGKTIKQWEDVNEKLGKVVSGLKGACYATSAVLVVKNFFSGLSGEAMARNEVMTMEGGWNDKCRQWSGKSAVQSPEGKTYTSVQACLLDNNDKINTAVSQYKTIIEKENELMKTLEERYKTPGDVLDWQGQVDSEKLKQAYCEESGFKSWYNSNKDTLQIEIKGEEKQYLKDIIDPSKVTNEKCDVDIEDMKMLMLKKKIDEGSYDDVLEEVVDNKLKTGLKNTFDINRLTKNDNILEKDIPEVESYVGNTKTYYQPMTDVSKVSGYSFKSGVTKVMRARIDGTSVIIGLVPTDNGEYKAEQAFDASTKQEFQWKKLNEKTGETIGYPIEKYFESEGIKEFTLANKNLYKNKMKGNPKVTYYEQAPYQGLPAQVPFDREEGWYVLSDYIVSGFGKPYEDSGRAVNFWICNVGSDGLIDGKNRDDCRYYNLGSTADLKFSGLSASQSAILVNKAERAIREASQQYGKKRVTILNQVFETEIAENGNTGNCADFMSPSDCNLLFNVCDPVMCPESRCDYGGKYRVDNVVQSGIIGSLLLCLPNAQEGVMVPICLSGVHAGIEGYLSILKSTQSCLNESLETGQNIGICDEIKSVYMCEFFWRQAAPLMDIFIPSIFELTLGQGMRGGGEYLTIDYAWQNVKNSIDYFKNEYAVNAMKAFNQRSTAEVGEEICKSYVSATYPSSSDFFDRLVEPDSPVQYHAWFSENVLTEATIPPTSHYKVYYHIYAGKDIGSHYVVYLTNPPESNLIHTLGVYVVDRGYIERGQQVDNARDFTGISGYQQLCISINGQDDCGFKQVTTSWAIEELSRQYAAEQATDKVTTSAECVAGEPSLYTLAQPNLDAGVQETISPELYKRGVLRVCSSENPGKSVDPSTGQIDPTNSSYDRWMKVGYCDDQSIGCWIDTESVKDVLSEAPGLLNNTLNEISLDYVDKLEDLPPEKVKAILKSGDELIGEIDNWKTDSLDKTSINKNINDVITNLKAITERGGTENYEKAEAFYKIGQIYDLITRKVYEKVIQLIKQGKTLSEISAETQAGLPAAEIEKKEEGRIYHQESWYGFGEYPIVNNLTFAKYEIDLVDTKFVKSIDGQTLYYTTDKPRDKLSGTWKISDSMQTNVYNSGKDFLSKEVRINFYEGWGFSSNPIVDVSAYKKFDINGQETKFVKDIEGNRFFFSVDGGVEWKEAESEMIIVYKNQEGTSSDNEGDISQGETIRITVGNWLSSSTPEVLVNSYVELNVNGEKIKFVKSVDEKAIYTSANFEEGKFGGYWKKANSEQLQVYLNN